MKTRMRRFWISVSLAASSLAFPLSGSLWSHDLPTRWTSGAHSTPSWNHLLDDCLDAPSMAGPRSLIDTDTRLRRGTEDWSSNFYPAELTSPLLSSATAHDFDMLARNPLSRFTKEMTCWVNDWHQKQLASEQTNRGQDQSQQVGYEVAWAVRPDDGQPPAPGLAPAPAVAQLSSAQLPTAQPSAPAYTGEEYAGEQYAANNYTADNYSDNEYAANEYSADEYSSDEYTSADYASEDYGAEDYGADNYAANDIVSGGQASKSYAANEYESSEYEDAAYEGAGYEEAEYAGAEYQGDGYLASATSAPAASAAENVDPDAYTTDTYISETDSYASDASGEATPGVDVSTDDLVDNSFDAPMVPDTCAFDAEYQARQSASELLAAEVARAAQVHRFQTDLAQALVDAAAVEETAALDTAGIQSESTSSESTSEVAAVDSFESQPHTQVATQLAADDRCGGEPNEILSSHCFPNRFAPGIVDEYVAYDLDQRDSHWLGGLGKSWKLHSAMSGPRHVPFLSPLANQAEYSLDGQAAVEAVAQAIDTPAAQDSYSSPDSYVVPESYVAPEAIDSQSELTENQDYEGDPWSAEQTALYGGYADDGQATSDNSDLLSTDEDTRVLNEQLDQLVEQAQQGTLTWMERARQAALPVMPMLPALTSTSDVLPGLMPDLTDHLRVASEWVEQQQCMLVSQLCGFECAYDMGTQLGQSSLEVTRSAFDACIAMGHYLDQSPEAYPASAEVYVIYVDADGSSLAVPGSLARAWNRPEPELADPANSDPANSDAAISEAVASDALSDSKDVDSRTEPVAAVDLRQLRAQLLATVAQHLDAIGMACLDTADQLTDWAEPQIASRQETDVR